MTATVHGAHQPRVPSRPTPRPDRFDVVSSDSALDLNLPQRFAERLWAPMLAMGLAGLAIGFVLAFVRADAVSAGDDAATLARLAHVQTAATFVGFTGVFSAVVFAVARILGVFRTGGGDVQAAVHGDVQTLRMPLMAKGMIVAMAMGMMALVGAVVAHVVVAGSIVGSTEAELLRAEQWAVVLEGTRRVGVSLYLLSIALGLATILHVLHFQAVRVPELVRVGDR